MNRKEGSNPGSSSLGMFNFNGGIMNQSINVAYLKGLNPCQARLDEFLKNYPEFTGSYSEFLDLDKVTYDDKIWVSKQFLTMNQLVHFSILCAQSVQPIFETKYPEDKCLQNLFSYLKDIPDFTKITAVQKDEIWALRVKVRAAANAADAAADAAAYTADAAAYAYAYADAAAYTAAYTAAYAADAAAYAYTAAYAADAAAYAAAYTAAYADAYTAAYAADARKQQKDLNLTFLKAVENL